MEDIEDIIDKIHENLSLGKISERINKPLARLIRKRKRIQLTTFGMREETLMQSSDVTTMKRMSNFMPINSTT